MLTRQRVLLALLDEARVPLNATVLVKLAFLAKRETEVRKDATFYDFVPYHFGPFSFALYRDLSALRDAGFVVWDKDSISLDPAHSADVVSVRRDLPVDLEVGVNTVVRNYGHLDLETLLRSVYERYPWFATNTKRADLLCGERPPRRVADLAVYAIGYQASSIDGFLAKLLQRGIRCVADVRANPVSRKYGFAGSRLRDLAAKVELEYVHFPSLGIPSKYRANLKTDQDYDTLFRTYQDDFLPGAEERVRELANVCTKQPTVLLCAEAEARYCHRSILAREVSARSGLPVVHM